MGKLTDRHCRNLTAPGKYADGHGLYLHVTAKGRYWRAAYRFDGKQKTASFGVYPRVSLKDELRTMRWEELDLNAALWTKPAHTMKKRRVHLIPLPRQALALIEALRIHTGHLPHVFANPATGKPISNGAAQRLKVRNGLHEEITWHGWRHTASTLLNEQGYDRDHIEMQLSHADKNSIRGTYNHAQYLDQRRAMLQAWADWLDDLKRQALARECH